MFTYSQYFETQKDRADFISDLLESGGAIISTYEDSWFCLEYTIETEGTGVWNDTIGGFV